jgi:hypothetical protein
MRRPAFVVCLLSVAALLIGCGEITSPGIEGRWAASGIELIALPSAAELHLLCAAPAHLAHGLLPDSAGVIRFSTQVQPLQLAASYRVDFLGRLAGNTLTATVTRTVDAGTPVTQTYVMLRDGDAGLNRIFCAL